MNKINKRVIKRPVVKRATGNWDLFFFFRIGSYFITKNKKILPLILLLLFGIFISLLNGDLKHSRQVLSSASKKEIKEGKYWFLLNRKSNMEFLYRGVPGDQSQSVLIKEFIVKTGIPNERPTPLPQLLGREYWVITKKYETKDNPETAPYFIELDVPDPEEEPFGPVPYLECDGQCNWIIPGPFGLHGINGNLSKLSNKDVGSSGCIRHRDEDITYLYNLVNLEKEEIRYYIKDI